MFRIYIIFCLSFATAFAIGWGKKKSMSTLLLEAFDNKKCYWRFPEEFVDKLRSTIRDTPDDPFCAIHDIKVENLKTETPKTKTPKTNAVFLLIGDVIGGQHAELHCPRNTIQKIYDAEIDDVTQWKFVMDTKKKTISLKHQKDGDPKVLLDAAKVTKEFLKGSKEYQASSKKEKKEYDGAEFNGYDPEDETVTFYSGGGPVNNYYKGNPMKAHQLSAAVHVLSKRKDATSISPH